MQKSPKIMIKILILTYYYFPGNFAGCYRIAAWAKYLKQSGYEPIIVTRYWKENETDFTAITEESEVSVEYLDGIRIHRVPYKGSLRDQLILKLGKQFNWLGKVLSLFQLILQKYFFKANPALSLYKQAIACLENESDIRWIITSGRPFYLFEFAHQIVQRFPEVKWIGDYRDPWNTNTNLDLMKFKGKFFRWLELSSEVQSTTSAEFLTTCSEGIKDNISTLITKKKIVVVTNGFEDFITSTEDQSAVRQIEIAYVGSLYHNQKIETFLNGLNSSEYNSNFAIYFYGIKKDSTNYDRIKKSISSSVQNIHFKPWMPKDEMIRALTKHDCFLLCGIPSRKGTYTAKFFDYLSMKKNIILCPGDQDILTKEVRRLNIGWVLNDEPAVKNWASEVTDTFNREGAIPFRGDIAEIAKYRYQNQIDRLVDHISRYNK